MKVLYLPPRYLDPDASEADKQVREYYERGMTMLHKNEQTALILPMFRDEKGNKMFELELVSITGQKAFDINAVIGRYKREIITTLMASQLVLGQDGGGGSFSLAESLSNVSAMVIRTRLQEIADQLNHDLIPQLFALNGWDVTNTPYFDFGEVDKESLEEIGKFVQRVGAAGLLPKTADVVNFLTERMGVAPQFDPQAESEDEFLAKLTAYTSNAGEGMEEGTTGSGTRKTNTGGDASTANLENV